MTAYRVFGAALGWFTLVAQYYVNVAQDGFVAGSITYFGFFTILGNFLVAFAFAATLLQSRHSRESGNLLTFFSRPGVRTAIGIYILVVGVIFFLLLRHVYRPTGLGWWLNISLHYLMPPVYLADWVLFVDKRRLRFSQIPYWLIFPLAYAFYVLIHGAVSQYYPYPFLDVASFGYGRVLLNMAGLTAMFGILGVLFVAVGRRLNVRR
jgi:hypothetical protein